ncbi:hypothetical protein NIES3585_47500 [Nodularia sp. NIES-3585]|nr:hypothetical protein NIES3585_47500 [Nodularia sp. NIES-3585]
MSNSIPFAKEWYFIHQYSIDPALDIGITETSQVLNIEPHPQPLARRGEIKMLFNSTYAMTLVKPSFLCVLCFLKPWGHTLRERFFIILPKSCLIQITKLDRIKKSQVF